jgi:hypothetical protein
MAETEVFRLTPVLNRCYEHAEYTRKQGNYPNERYFVNIPPRYVGELIRREEGPGGDGGGWRRDYFRDLTGNEVAVNYSYEGRTCFREVPCGPKPLPQEHLEAIQNRNNVPSLKSLAFAQLPTKTVSEVRENFDTVLGGKTRKGNKKSKRKPNRKLKSKRRKSKKYLKSK